MILFFTILANFYLNSEHDKLQRLWHNKLRSYALFIKKFETINIFKYTDKN